MNFVTLVLKIGRCAHGPRDWSMWAYTLPGDTAKEVGRADEPSESVSRAEMVTRLAARGHDLPDHLEERRVTRPGRIALGSASAAVEFVHGPLAENPHRVGKPLHFELESLHSARRGNYRVIHQIVGAQVEVPGITLQHRADAYR